MDVTEIDSNLKIETSVDRPGVIWRNALEAPFRLYGLQEPREGEQLCRMPGDAARAVSPGVNTLNYCTAGGRIRFSTSSSYIAIHLVRGIDFGVMPHFPLTGSHAADLYLDRQDSEGKVRSDFIRTFLPPNDAHAPSYDAVIDVGNDGMRSYTIHLPLYAAVKELYIGLQDGAAVNAGYEYDNVLPVVYYGSSITQGGCASHAGNSYPAMISQKYNLHYLNLGFSGSCHGEPAMADYLASLSMSAFVCDYDYNAPTLAHLRQTLPPLIAAVRSAHPTLPILVLPSPRLSHNGVPSDRRVYLRDFCRQQRAAGDANLHFVDSNLLFGDDMPFSCTMDGCHPNDLGFYRMATAIANALLPHLR